MEKESTSYTHYLSYLPSVWDHFWGQIIIVATALSLLIIYPVCRAFHSGLIAVRDPAFRDVPQNPWELMDQILWRELRWWIQCWSLVFVLYSGMFFLLNVDDFKDEPLQSILVGLSFPALIIGLGSLLVASCIFWAPRRIGFTSILLTTWLTGSLAYLVSLICSYLLVIDSYGTVLERFVIVGVRRGGLSPGNMFLSTVIWSTLINVLIAILFWRSAHKKGDRWFRFEE